MMRRHPIPARPLWLRLLAGALVLWLAPVLLDPTALHSCPMHDAVPLSAHGAGGMAGMPGMVATSLAVERGAPAPHAHGSHVHGCTCLGTCALAGAVLAPSVVAVAPVSPAALSSDAPVESAPHARGATSHFLPFAHAPPLLS